jgi:hypothetical protein
MPGQWLSQDLISNPGQFGAGPQPVFRDHLDAVRSMWRRTPEAEYADGYLQTIDANRREGRRVPALDPRREERGPMAGTRMPPDAYRWTDDINLMSGLEAQARGERFTQRGRPVEVISERSARMSGEVEISPMAARFQRFRPPWA